MYMKTLEERFDKEFVGDEMCPYDNITCCLFTQRTDVKTFIKEEIVRHLEMVEKVLDGINREEDNDGWWETSAGATFGQEIFNKIESIKERL